MPNRISEARRSVSVVALLLLYPWAGGCMWAGLGWAGGWMRFLTCQFCHWLALGTRHSALHHFLFHITRPQHLGMGPPTGKNYSFTSLQRQHMQYVVCTYIITNNINIVIICYVASTKFSNFKVIFTQNVGHAAAGRSARFLLLPISGVTRT